MAAVKPVKVIDVAVSPTILVVKNVAVDFLYCNLYLTPHESSVQLNVVPVNTGVSGLQTQAVVKFFNVLYVEIVVPIVAATWYSYNVAGVKVYTVLLLVSTVTVAYFQVVVPTGRYWIL